MSRAMPLALRRLGLGFAVCGLLAAAPPASAEPGNLPDIRMSAANRVPACVTPERLMAFVITRNRQLAPKFAQIAATYRDQGERARVRWDYAFFQMVLETNYLMYRRGDGSSGDVGQAQNNFAGIGATGGGVAGDQYPDVRTGVLAHMQHLVAYSGERIEQPVAKRTREAQGDIIEVSRKLGRPVNFADLARRWAVDRGYAKNIETVADLYRRNHCPEGVDAVAIPAGFKPRTAFAAPNKLGAGAVAGNGPVPAPQPAIRVGGEDKVRTIWRRGDPVPPAPQLVTARPPAATVEPTVGDAAPVVRAEPVVLAEAVPHVEVVEDSKREGFAVSGVARFALAAEAGAAAGHLQMPAVKPAPCRIYSASYGGTRTLLIQAKTVAETRLTAVTVSEAQGRGMTESYIADHAPGAVVLGDYASKDDALVAARGVCATY